MGCGSSHPMRVVTPLRNGGAMVPPFNWTHEQLKTSGLMPEYRSLISRSHIAVQTNHQTYNVDTPVQTDASISWTNSWETNEAETQTPIDEDQELERIFAQMYSPESLGLDRNMLPSAEASVQTTWNKSDLSTQTEIFQNDKVACNYEVHQTSEDTGATPVATTVSVTSSELHDNVPDEFPDVPVKKVPATPMRKTFDISRMPRNSPFAHLEKELFQPSREKNGFRRNTEEAISMLLQDVQENFQRHSIYSDNTFRFYCKEVAVQTENDDPTTDEAPEYAARPPPCKKLEMIPDKNIFNAIDKHAVEAPDIIRLSLTDLVEYLTINTRNELFKVRAFFRWITNNMTYDWKYMDVKQTTEEILDKKQGVCKDYCKLFEEMSKSANIRVKRVHGFAKGYDYRPGHQFQPGEDITHAWNAVFIFGSWRLLDVTWGTGYTDHAGKFQRRLNEHFFMTDPEVLIWTHCPYSEVESNYYRWQLLDKSLRLEEFNALPKVTPFFFEYNLRIWPKPQSPVMVRMHAELKLVAHRPMRYKYKLYSAENMENTSLNSHVFCQLKEDRLIGCFSITPPEEGTYYFKVYARPESQMYDDSTLKNVAIFLLECVKAKKHKIPLPVNDVPWGPTQCFFDMKLKLVDQSGPVLVIWGGKKKLVIDPPEEMLITYQVFDTTGKELDARSLSTMVEKEEEEMQPLRIILSVAPQTSGFFKMLIFGMPKPKEKGRWKLPLLASFLIDAKLPKNTQEDETSNNNSSRRRDYRKRRTIPKASATTEK